MAWALTRLGLAPGRACGTAGRLFRCLGIRVAPRVLPVFFLFVQHVVEHDLKAPDVIGVERRVVGDSRTQVVEEFQQFLPARLLLRGGSAFGFRLLEPPPDVQLELAGTHHLAPAKQVVHARLDVQPYLSGPGVLHSMQLHIAHHVLAHLLLEVVGEPDALQFPAPRHRSSTSRTI